MSFFLDCYYHSRATTFSESALVSFLVLQITGGTGAFAIKLQQIWGQPSQVRAIIRDTSVTFFITGQLRPMLNFKVGGRLVYKISGGNHRHCGSGPNPNLKKENSARY